MFFPLNYRCTILEPNDTRDDAGQSISETPTVISTATKCLYYDMSGNKKAVVGEVFQTVMAFYVEAVVDIEEGYIVRDIKDRLGNVVRAGPFEVESVKPVPGLKGRVHHKSCKLVGIA